MMQAFILRALLYGAAAGARTSSPLVAVAHSERPWEWYLLLGEMLVDKLPQTPSRLIPGAWIARICTAAFGAYRDSDESIRQNLAKAVVAGLSAAVMTKLAHDLRAGITQLGYPDPLIACMEDALMLACVVHLRDRGEISGCAQEGCV